MIFLCNIVGRFLLDTCSKRCWARRADAAEEKERNHQRKLRTTLIRRLYVFFTIDIIIIPITITITIIIITIIIITNTIIISISIIISIITIITTITIIIISIMIIVIIITTITITIIIIITIIIAIAITITITITTTIIINSFFLSRGRGENTLFPLANFATLLANLCFFRAGIVPKPPTVAPLKIRALRLVEMSRLGLRCYSSGQ